MEKTFRPIVTKLGYFPSAADIDKRKAGVVVASCTLIRQWGGLSEIARRMGVPTWEQYIGRTRKDFFREWHNVVRTFEPIVEQLGYFPSCGQLEKRILGVPNCVNSLYRYWGGPEAVARKLGVPTYREYHENRVCSCGGDLRQPNPYSIKHR